MSPKGKKESFHERYNFLDLLTCAYFFNYITSLQSFLFFSVESSKYFNEEVKESSILHEIEKELNIKLVSPTLPGIFTI